MRDVFFDFPGRPEAAVQVVGLGSNAVDWILQLPRFPAHGGKLRVESRTRLGGGQVATATALCARFGLGVRYIGRVGDDEDGRFMLEVLSRDGLDLSCFEVIPDGDTQTAFILVDPRGERTILWNRDPRLLYQPGEIRPDSIQIGEILHLDSHDQGGAIQAACLAQDVGMKTSLDIDKIQPGVAELLELIDFLIPTLSFVQHYTGLADAEQALLALDQSVPGFLVATAGSRGCLAAWEGGVYEVPGFAVEPIDTTGAGDVFHGAFIYALFQKWSVRKCLLFANAAAAISTTRIGSRAGIPSLAEVEAWLA